MLNLRILSSKPRTLRGLLAMLSASLLFSLMSVSVYALGVRHPELPTMTVSFFRIIINLAILLLPALIRSRVPSLLGDMRPSLWLRGLFGSLALILSFISIQRIGPGEASFLGASSGVFVALLGPKVLAQRNSGRIWAALAGSLAGLYLLLMPRADVSDELGRLMALSSGLLSALAYLMVARAGRSNPPGTVVFYFCAVAIPMHLAWFGVRGFKLPQEGDAWALLLLCGLAASGAQVLMTRAYQESPAALVSAVSYATPVFNLAFGWLLFAKVPVGTALAGCAMILFCGVLLPFLSNHCSQPSLPSGGRRKHMDKESRPRRWI
ncbi:MULTISPECIES: DMT family transporter [Methylococcus]|uniref:DMT family transporter n=1 Tax=Methylococcus capsulatus TaxID=414 RepID=A0ABZ2F3I1_METCP|nr:MULTISPECIES: DMT family transporter [Methylococcus]MDF9392005.1 DMT family transporter [Methylococcus capsulatus]